MTDQADTTDDQLRRLTGQLERHTATLRSFKAEPLHPLRMRDLAAMRCSLCKTSDLLMSGYPFTNSALFARALLLHCSRCGLSWVPIVPFDLGKYYAQSYADEIQPYRMYEGEFYDSANPFWSTDQAARYISRADFHIDLLRKFGGDVDSILDYGAGLGITLHRLPDATRKFACELDPFSQNILRNEGVELVEALTQGVGVQAIITSHALEHLLLNQLTDTLKWFYELLPPGGTLVIEVPKGYNMMAKFLRKTGHTRFRQEPHTIFFSSLSLAGFLKRAGFELAALNLCGWSQARVRSRGEGIIPDLAKIRIEGPQLVAVARRPC